MSGYAELAVATNFSFLRGASHAEELVEQAAALGLSAIGIADRNSMAGVVRAHIAAKDSGVKLLVGTRLITTDGFETIAYPTNRAAYGRLCRLLTRGNRRAKKGECHIAFDEILEHAEGQIFIVIPGKKDWHAEDAEGAEEPCNVFKISPGDRLRGLRVLRVNPLCVTNETETERHRTYPLRLAASRRSANTLSLSPPVNGGGVFASRLSRLRIAAPQRVYLGAAFMYGNRAARRIAELAELSRQTGVPMVAINDVHYHVPERQILQDVLTCVREKTTIDKAGKLLAANAERHLKSAVEMTRLFAKYPEAISRTLDIADQVNFSLDELRYEYPDDVIGGGGDPQSTLTRLTWEGAARRYPAGVPDKVRGLLEHELALIGELKYAPYFLTVWDLVEWARAHGILCQGRGSAANSAVCFVLGITAVDPMQIDLLFERFISTERNEPPDIDVDFEHERREEVMQHIYQKYGRHRAGIAATVISYRSKSAIRDVGKALGLSEDMVGLLSGNLFSWGHDAIAENRLREVGLDPADERLTLAVTLAKELYGFPRHLSQHVGGFVITRGPLEELIPIGNAAMEDRTFVEWDKDDLDALGILKIDVLALGMLTCIAKAFALLKTHYGVDHDLASIPQGDATVYDMLCKGDSVGVFQVESRAQMSMLPRLKPRDFFDLVIEVAIVRPGPIQGDMVHPYLRRRDGTEPVSYPTAELEQVLKFTLGVPLFQEQAMKIAIVCAGFTPAEADKLRRAMATFRRSGTIPMFRQKFIAGMVSRGYETPFAERCFHQIEGFADYGFPMSHAASFALLVYVSAWLKHHYPDVFCAAILNAQPMGFYAPAQLVRDARDHGVEVRAPDVNESVWDCTLEASAARHAVRLGLRQIKGFRQEDADALAAARGRGFDGVRHLALAAGLGSEALIKLAEADCFRSLSLDRRQALWSVKGLDGGAEPARAPVAQLPLFAAADPERLRREEEVHLPAMRLGEHIVQDYMTLKLSLKAHPLSLLRANMDARHVVPNAKLVTLKNGASVRVSGLVLVRQRPGTANGVIFATLEDETGIANIIVWNHVFERFRREVLGARLLMAAGTLQREGLVTHVVAHTLTDLTGELSLLSAERGPECEALAHADQVKRDGYDARYPAPHRHPRNAEVMPKSRDFR